MTDELRIGVGRQGSSVFHVGRTEDELYAFVRDPDAAQFVVSRSDEELAIGALASASVDVVVRAFVSIPFEISLTLRGNFTLYRIGGGAIAETIVADHSWVWRFTPYANHGQYANHISNGQVVSFVSYEGVGPLRPSTDYRMVIKWMSYSGGADWSYNALQTVDFTTGTEDTYDVPWFEKRVVKTAPEW